MEPKHDIKQVKILATDLDIEHWFSRKRATTKVVEIMGFTYDEAKQFILDEICNLDTSNFCERVLIQRDCYDVYGKRINGIPWYIKFSILTDENGEYLANISFHPTERELKTNSEILEAYT